MHVSLSPIRIGLALAIGATVTVAHHLLRPERGEATPAKAPLAATPGPASRAKPPAGAATGPASRPVPVARAAATAPAGAAKQGKGSAPPGRSAASAGTRTISPITAARGLQRVVIHHRRPGAVVLTLDGSRVDVEFTELGPGPARPTHKESK